MKPNPKKRCTFCGGWYTPDARTRTQQLACGRWECRKKRKAQADRTWRIKHPDYGGSRNMKVRAWARNFPDYWRQYRRTHQEYASKDIERRVRSRSKAELSAKQDAIRQFSLELFQSVQKIGVEMSAKQDGIARRVEGIEEYLVRKGLSAKPNDTDLVMPP